MGTFVEDFEDWARTKKGFKLCEIKDKNGNTIYTTHCPVEEFFFEKLGGKPDRSNLVGEEGNLLVSGSLNQVVVDQGYDKLGITLYKGIESNARVWVEAFSSDGPRAPHQVPESEFYPGIIAQAVDNWCDETRHMKGVDRTTQWQLMTGDHVVGILNDLREKGEIP